MAAIQLNFTLRTSGNVKTVHLLGSWDSYAGQLPLSKDSSKSGAWKSTFRFPASAMRQGQRYWYYYIIDGYHVSHDPARESVTEPTTGRRLNILDIPAGSPSDASASSRQSRRISVNVPKGRPASSIVSPKPYKPGQTRQICAEQFANATMEQLAARFAAQQVSGESSSEEDSEDSDSDDSSDVPSLTSSRSSGSRASSPSSSVSSSSSRCSCERYGITRAGLRIKLDCGGARCGSGEEDDDEDDSECCSDEDEDEDEKMQQYRRAVLLAQQQQKQVRQPQVARRQVLVARR